MIRPAQQKMITISRHAIPEKRAEIIRRGRWVAVADINNYGITLGGNLAQGLREGEGPPAGGTSLFEKIEREGGRTHMRIKDERVKQSKVGETGAKGCNQAQEKRNGRI